MESRNNRTERGISVEQERDIWNKEDLLRCYQKKIKLKI